MAKKVKIKLQSDLLLARKDLQSKINQTCKFVLKENHCTVVNAKYLKKDINKIAGKIIKVQNKHIICEKTDVKIDDKFILNQLFMVLIYDIISYEIL